MTGFAKGAVAALGAALMLLTGALTDGSVSNLEWLQVAASALTAFQVAAFANHAAQPYVKAGLAGLGAVFTFLIGVLPDHHFGVSDWPALGISVLTAVGVFTVPNGKYRPASVRRTTHSAG